MASINPAMASVIQSYAPQQAPLINKDDKISDKTTGNTSASGNTTVTLSSVAQAMPSDYSNLASAQTIKQTESTENKTIQQNETLGSDLTYSSNLQLRSNYYQDQVMKLGINT